MEEEQKGKGLMERRGEEGDRGEQGAYQRYRGEGANAERTSSAGSVASVGGELEVWRGPKELGPLYIPE